MTTIGDALAAVDRLPAVEPCTIAVACEVVHERKRQTVRWGVQQLPDGTGSDRAQVYADAMKRICDRASDSADSGGTVTWAQMLLEEVAEAMTEKPGASNLRVKLLRIAALCVQWVEDIDHRAADEDPFGTSCVECAKTICDHQPTRLLENGDPVHIACCDTDAPDQELTALADSLGLQWRPGKGLTG